MRFRKGKSINDDELINGSFSEKQTNPPDINRLRELFEKSRDVQFVSYQFNHFPIMLIYCSGLISNDMMYNSIPQRLEAFFSRLHSKPTKKDIMERLYLPSIGMIETDEQAISDIFAGKLFLDFGVEGTIFSVDISERPQRKPEETKTEVDVLGPRDNFIEDISINIALIRKRLRTASLVIEPFEIGRRTKTKVSVLFIEDIADKEIFQQIKKKLDGIDIDGLFSGTQLEELINESPWAMFPRYSYTGRPDFAVQSLLKGRFIILIDGVTYAYVTPINLFFLLKGGEDKEVFYAFNSFQRLMRITAVVIATLLPGFWVALTAFHQNQIPFTFLATIVESRRGVPLSTSVEVLLMLLIFEIFREAGMRLPMAIGQTLSVIGGLIIGDAAIRAGLTSPATLVVIAGSTIATFTLTNQSLAGTVSILRFFIVILVSFLGFFGFFVGLYFILVYLANIRTFGVPYMGLVTRIDARNILKSILRLPDAIIKRRPSTLNPEDSSRKGEDSP